MLGTFVSSSIIKNKNKNIKVCSAEFFKKVFKKKGDKICNKHVGDY